MTLSTGFLIAQPDHLLFDRLVMTRLFLLSNDVSSYEAGFLAGSIISGSLVSLIPTDGTVLNVDPEIARFTPIRARISLDIGTKLFIFVTIGSMSWTVFDGSNVAPFFGDHTTIIAVASNLFDVSVLPNGGWWRSSINIQFVVGKVL